MAVGTLLLNFSKPEQFEPFILTSLLFSIALVPILLVKRSAPKFKKISFIKIRQLYKISPLGTFSMLCTGLIHSAIFGYGAVYATTLNFTIFEISLFSIFNYNSRSNFPISNRLFFQIGKIEG